MTVDNCSIDEVWAILAWSWKWREALSWNCSDPDWCWKDCRFYNTNISSSSGGRGAQCEAVSLHDMAWSWRANAYQSHCCIQAQNEVPWWYTSWNYHCALQVISTLGRKMINKIFLLTDIYIFLYYIDWVFFTSAKFLTLLSLLSARYHRHTPAHILNALDKAFNTTVKCSRLSTDPWCTPVFTSKPTLSMPFSLTAVVTPVQVAIIAFTSPHPLPVDTKPTKQLPMELCQRPFPGPQRPSIVLFSFPVSFLQLTYSEYRICSSTCCSGQTICGANYHNW